MRLLQERIDECKGALSLANVAFGAKRAEPKDVDTYGFKKDPKDFNVYWDVRKGLIPIVGGARETGLLLHLLPLSSSMGMKLKHFAGMSCCIGKQCGSCLHCWFLHCFVPTRVLVKQVTDTENRTPLSYWVHAVHTSGAHSLANTGFMLTGDAHLDLKHIQSTCQSLGVEMPVAQSLPCPKSTVTVPYWKAHQCNIMGGSIDVSEDFTWLSMRSQAPVC